MCPSLLISNNYSWLISIKALTAALLTDKRLIMHHCFPSWSATWSPLHGLWSNYKSHNNWSKILQTSTPYSGYFTSNSLCSLSHSLPLCSSAQSQSAAKSQKPSSLGGSHFNQLRGALINQQPTQLLLWLQVHHTFCAQSIQWAIWSIQLWTQSCTVASWIT